MADAEEVEYTPEQEEVLGRLDTYVESGNAFHFERVFNEYKEKFGLNQTLLSKILGDVCEQCTTSQGKVHEHRMKILVFVLKYIKSNELPQSAFAQVFMDQLDQITDEPSGDANREVAEAFFKEGFDPDTVAESMEIGRVTLIEAAMASGSEKSLDLLLKYGAKPEKIVNKDRILFHIVNTGGEPPNMRMLNYVIDNKLATKEGMDVALLVSVMRGPKIVKFFLEKGADPNAIASVSIIGDDDNEHKYPLIAIEEPLEGSDISEEDAIECARLLLDAGAKIDAQDSAGRTLLMRSAEIGAHKLFDFLLERGASTKIKDNEDRTVKEIAISALASSDRDKQQNIALILVSTGRAEGESSAAERANANKALVRGSRVPSRSTNKG